MTHKALLLLKRYDETIKAADAAIKGNDFLDDTLAPRAYEIRAAANCALGKKVEARFDEAEAKRLGGEIKTPCR